MNDFEALDYFRKQTGSSGTLEDTLRFYEQARKNREEQQAQQQAQQQEAINKLQSIKQGGTTAAVADPEIPAGYTAAYKDKSKPEHPENVFNKALADTSYENRLQTVKDWNASFGSTYLDPASQAALAREIKKGEIPSWGIVKPKSWNIVDNDLFDSARFGLGDVVAGAAQGIGRYFGSDPLVKWGQSEKAAIEKLKETAFSDDTKNKLKRQGEIRQEAAGKGAEAEFVAELKSFATAPLNTIASSAGSFVPAAGLAITATALGAPAAAATGLAILASAALGTSNATDNFEKIAKLPESELRKLKGFDEVLKASGGDIAKARDVIGTQASNEDFWLQAAIEGVGAGLSVASGAGKALIKTFTKNGLSKNAAEKASKEGLKAVAKTTAVETIQEGGVEGASQVSKNRAFNSVGGDVSLLDGVVSATTGGALAGGSLGAGTASVSAIISNSKGAEPSAVDPAKPVAQKTPVQETGAAMAKQSLFDALSTGNIDEIEKARTIYENVGDVELAEKEWGSKNAGTNTNPAGSSANVDNANVQPANNAGVQPASTNAGVPDTESGNATAAGDGTTEGNAGTVDAATQPAVRQATKFAEFIPEETGNKPNTEAINRAITEIKGGGQTINIASAKSWAEQHYDSYVDYVGKNEAQKASKDSFVDGTVANILARAQAVDGNLRGDAKQIAKDRNDTLAKNEPDYEGYSRQEKGDRRTVDGSLRTEPQYRKDQRDFNDALEINTRSKSVDAVIAKVKEKDREPILEKIEAALNLDAKNQLPNDANGLKAIKRLKIDEQESILGITPPSFKKRYLQKAATQGQANAPTTAAEQQTRTGNKVQPSAVVQAKPSAAPMGKEQDSKGRTTDSKVNEPKPIDLVGKFVSYGGIKGLLKEDKQGNLYIESINAGGKVYIDSALSGKNARELGLFGATIRAKAPKTKQEQNAQAQKIENKPYIKPANKDAAESYAAQQDSANALSEAAIKENQQIKEFLDTTGLLSLEYGDEIAGYILEEIEKKLGKNISRESIIKEIEDAINSGYQPFQNAASDDKGNQRNAQGGATENSPASPAKTEAKQESVDDGKTNLDGVPDAALDDVLTKIGLEEKARAKIQSTNLNNPNRTGNGVQPSTVAQTKPSAAPVGKGQDSKGRATDSKVNEPKPVDLVGKFVSYSGIKGLLKEDKQGNFYIESINAGGKVYIDSALSGKTARELGLFGATIRAKAPKTKQEQNAQAQKIENKPYIKPANKDAAESYAAQQDSANALSEAAIKENQQIKEFLDTTGLLSLEYGDEIAGYILEEIEKKLGKNISRESIIKEIEDAINSGYQPFQNAASDDKGNQRNAQGGATENSPASPAKTEAKQESVDDGKTNLDGVPDAALDDVLTKIGLEEKARAKIQSTNLNNPNFLRITKSELFEINPDLPAFYSRKNGVSISTRVADGDFDAWLPYSMRHDSSRFDEIESTNEIKNYLAEILDSKKPFYDYETRMEIKNSSIIIEQLQTQLNELQDTNAINAELASYTESDEYKQWASELAEEQFIADSKDSDTGTTEAKPQPKNESASLGKPTFEQKNGDSTINDIEAALKPKELIKHVKNIYQNTGGIDQNQADNITEKSVNAIKQNDALITNAMLFKAPIDPIRDLKNANSLIIDGLLVRGIGSQIATRFQTHRLNDAGISLIKRIRQLNSELSDAQARKQIDKTDGFLTQPTPEGLRAKTEREAAAPYAERAALDRLQGNTDGGFQLTPQEGRNDASGVLFSQSTAAKNPTTSTAVRSAIEGIFGNAKGVWDSISKSTVIVATRSDVPKDAITVGTLKSLPLAVQDDLLSSYTREDALAKQAREEQAAKDESKPAPAVRGKSFKAEQVDLFNPQNALFSQNDDSAQAFYDPPTGKIYLIADRIQKGTEAAVWLHEVSHKQLLSLLGKENLSKLNSAVTSWHRRKEGSVERAIYEAANARAESAARVVYGETKLSDKQQAIIVDSYNSSIYRGGKKLGTTVDIKQSKESAAVSDAFKALAKDAGYEIKDNNGKETKYFTLTKYDAVLDADVDLQVRVSDHSNINRSQHFGETDINIAPDDGYKTDSFESALWKLNNARIELDSNGITGTLYYGQIKAEPFYSKTDLLTKGEIDKKIYNAEFLAYAIEEAVNRGVTPDAKKGTISAAGWMARVKQLFEGALARLVGKPSMLSANDLVAMAYGAAQLELQGKNAGGNGGAQASLTPFDGKEQAKTPLGGTKTVTVDGKEYSVFNNLGKPIHPTVEGVRNFVRWFGDSKVTDSGKTMAQGGKPKVFYHGTSHAGYKGGAFAAFETYNESGRQNLYGDGAYFTENVDVASSYTTKGRGGAATVYPVYLKIINPLNMDLVNNNAEFKKLFPGEEFSSLDDKNQKTNAKVYKELQEDLAYNEIYDYDANEILRGGIESGGYDGITHIGGGKFNKKDETRHAVFIAFHPEQIKSATGNNGNYNPEKIDIHLSIAPSNPRQSINDAIATLPTESQKAIRDVYGENYQELASDVVKTAAGKPIPKFIRYTKAVAQAIKKALGALVSAMATASIFFSPDSFAQTEGRTIKTDSTKTIAKGTMPDSAMAGMSDAGKLSLAIISNDKEFKKGVAFVADKPNARLYVFKDGKYQGETAALFGRTKGDVQTEYGASTGKPNLKSFLESDKVTPAGKYAATAMDVAGYGRLVYFNNDDGLAIHVNKSSGDTRQFRLETPTPLDNKVTFGCVNTTQDFYDKYLSTLPLNEQATVYVVPEVYSPSEVFEMGGKASGANRKGGASFTSQFAVRDQAEVRPMAEVDKLNPLTNAGLALAQTFVDYKARGKYEIQQAIFAAEKEGNTESVVANRKLLEQMGVAANAGAVVTDRLMDNIVKPLNKKIIAIAKKAGGSMTPDGLQIGAGEYAVARHSLHLSKKRAAQIADELAATKATLDFAIDVKAISRQIEKEIDLAKTKILDSVQRLRDGKIVSKSTVNKQVNEIHALINTIVGGTNNELTKNELTKLNNALLNAVQDQATLGNIETMAAIGKRLAEQAVELTDLKAARAAYNKAKTASEQWMQAQGQVSRYKGDTTQQAAIPLPSGLTIKEAQSIINDREAESPSYKEVADLYVQAFRDINQDRVNRGAASQEELDALTKENPFYVSTSGQTSATVETNIGFGRSRQWYDVAEGAQSFFNSQRTLANIVAKTQQAGNQEAATRIGKAAYESFVAGGDLFEETSPTNTDALRYEKDGIKYYLTGKTEPVRKSFKVLSEEVSKQAIVKGHAYFTSLYGRTLTQYVPIFSPINFSKDIGTRFFNFIGRRDIVREDGTQLGKMGAYSLRGNFLKQLARPSLYSDAFNFAWRGIETDSLKAFRTEGGLMTFSDSLTTAEEISAEFKTPLKAVPAKVINAINKIAHKYNQVLEVALVLASYRAMVAEGLSSQSAAFQTLDMMNFGQKGVLTNPLLRPFYAFINPTAQDALQIKRTLYKDGQFNIAAAAEFSALVGLSVLAYGMLRDADEEDEFGKKKVDSQGAGTVSRNLMIPDGSGGYYKLGVPFGLPQIAYSWGVAYHRMLDGVYTEKEAAGEMIGSMAKAFTLTGGSEVPMVRDFSTWLTYTASPTLYKPFITTALGKDAFGNNIKPYQRKDRLASEQGGFQTAEAYKEAAQWGQKTLGIDRAPEEYKALVEGYFVGPMRAVVNAIVDKQADNDIKGIDKKEPTPLETALGFTRVKSSTSDVNIVNHYYYKATADADAIVLKMNTEIPKTALRESFEQKIERFKQAGATDEEVNILEAKNEYDKTYSKFLANRKVAYGKFIGGDDEASALMGQYFAEDMEEKRKFLKVVFANKEKP